METASSPRMGADVTPEQQRKHEQLADRARERAVVRSLAARTGVADPHPSCSGAGRRYRTRRDLRQHQRCAGASTFPLRIQVRHFEIKGRRFDNPEPKDVKTTSLALAPVVKV